MSLKIGITESGDPSIDYSWVVRMVDIDGAVIITKNLSDKLISHIMNHKDKIIIHATCTGYGRTNIEPNVPYFENQLDQIRKIIQMGFSKEKIILRVDPIIPDSEYLEYTIKVLDSAKDFAKIVRVSVLDMYPHVIDRFQKSNIPIPNSYILNGKINFKANEISIKEVNDILLSYKEYEFESCAEPLLTVKAVGCVSNRDLRLLNIQIPKTEKLSNQRPDCLCCSYKTELLTSKHRCKNECLYCYWKD